MIVSNGIVVWLLTYHALDNDQKKAPRNYISSQHIPFPLLDLGDVLLSQFN
jgi:hypothetical protein